MGHRGREVVLVDERSCALAERSGFQVYADRHPLYRASKVLSRMGENMAMGNRLRELRARYGMMQGELARAIGVTRQTIIAIENGSISLR
ncbi:MAG: helix-turn-helix domain-containing protein [Nitrososphaerota archaeon]